MSLVGNLEDLGLGDILQIVSLSRKSGVLYLRGEADAEGRRTEGEIIFQNGQVIRATSTEATGNIGELLVARGVLTDSQLEEALAVQRAAGNRERLGQLLVRQFATPPDKIQEAIRKQTEAIVYAFFRWPRGDFSFELREADGALDKVDVEMRHMVLDAGLNPQFLAMEGTRLKDEARSGRIPDPATIPVRPREVQVDAPASADPAPGAPSANGAHPQAAPPGSPAPAPRVPDPAPVGPGTSAPAAVQEDPFADLSVDATEFADAPVGPPASPAPPSPPAAARAPVAPVPLPGERAGPAPGSAAPAKTPVTTPPVAAPPVRKPAPAAAPVSPAAPRPHRPGGPTIDLVQELGLGKGQAALGGQASRGLGMLRAMISELTNPEAHGQITLLILRFAAELMRRAVLFLVKEDEVVGLGQFGIDLEGDNPDRVVRGIRVPRGEPSLFLDVLTRRSPYKGPLADAPWNGRIIETLGGHRPAEVFCAPISSGTTIAAILYADNAPEETPIGDTEALEIFLHQAGIQMEKALLERKIRELNRPAR